MKVRFCGRYFLLVFVNPINRIIFEQCSPESSFFVQNPMENNRLKAAVPSFIFSGKISPANQYLGYLL
jgi:hypothetical protein